MIQRIRTLPPLDWSLAFVTSLSFVTLRERVPLLHAILCSARETLRQLVGPGAWEKWINWQSQTSEQVGAGRGRHNKRMIVATQAKRAATRNELIRMIGTETVGGNSGIVFGGNAMVFAGSFS